MKNKRFLFGMFGSAPALERLLLNCRATAWCFFLLFSCFLGTEAYAQNMTQQQRQQMYVNYLKAEGFSPQVDSDGYVKFKYEGGTYYIFVSENDPQYFVIGYLYFWKIESDELEWLAALNTANAVTRNKKVVKVYLTEDLDDVSISAEIFLKDPADFSTVFYRLINIMTEARQDFIAEMRSWREN